MQLINAMLHCLLQSEYAHDASALVVASTRTARTMRRTLSLNGGGETASIVSGPAAQWSMTSGRVTQWEAIWGMGKVRGGRGVARSVGW
jgi:hypothetical protein